MPDTVSICVPVRSLDQWEVVARQVAVESAPDELVVQSGPGIRWARNRAARASVGTIMVASDDDVKLYGDWTWFLTRPPAETWWVAWSFSTTVDDSYTRLACPWLTLQSSILGMGASMGCFQAVRREAFEAVGGYDEGATNEDYALARALKRRFGPPARAPFHVEILRRIATFVENWERTAKGDVTDAQVGVRRVTFRGARPVRSAMAPPAR